MVNGNYAIGIKEQIVFPEISNIDKRRHDPRHGHHHLHHGEKRTTRSKRTVTRL
jgi:ribosomal protein L5